MRHLFFYLRYAGRSLRRSGQWTTFAVFCVAAGVATVVALRSLGLAITDSLLSNVRQFNHGDISLSSVGSFGPFAFTVQRGSDERQVFQDWQVETVRAWTARRGGQMTAFTIASNVQITPLGASSSRPQFASSYLIDPPTFAIAGDIVALDPAGVPLRDLFQGGPEVVISENLAEAQGIAVGDPVQISGTEVPFIVRGIVPTDAEASINNVFASFFGFAYFDRAQAPAMGLSPLPNTIGIVLPDADGPQIEAAASEVGGLIPVREVNATPWLLRRNRELSDMVGRFIVAMGLGALLIGGVGIMNTMLVLVGRRTMEIAALKTFGLKGRQVAGLFAAEALILGVIGSALGVAVGLLLTGAVNAYGEAFLQQKLPWRLYPEAVMYGLVLGLAVTLVFGLLPVLTATKVRPGLILRPNEVQLPRAGCVQVALALGLVVLALGFIAGRILGPVVDNVAGSRAPDATLLGIAGAAAALLFLAFLVGLLWWLVWGISRLPTLGSADLRLALRSLTTRRLRTAVTLLALTAGMFALSSITFFGLGAREVIRFQFSETLGGNILALPLLPPEIGDPVLDVILRNLDGVQHTSRLSFNTGRLIAVDGSEVRLEGRRSAGVPLVLLSRDSDNPALNSGPVLAGRDLTPEDRGRSVIVLSAQSLLEAAIESYTLDDLGVEVGSTVIVQMRGRPVAFEVVGIVGSPSGFAPNIAGAYLPPNAPGVTVDREVRAVQVAPDRVDGALRALAQSPLVFAVDVTFIDALMKRLLDQLSAIPTIVGLLSLLAAAVIMANTVALATLERRRQIGVLKAVGLKRRRVFSVMLLENTLIGLLGALLGIGLSLLGVNLLTALGTGLVLPIPSDALPIAAGLVVAAVLIAWTATFLSARAVVRERVAVVLRYE